MAFLAHEHARDADRAERLADRRGGLVGNGLGIGDRFLRGSFFSRGVLSRSFLGDGHLDGGRFGDRLGRDGLLGRSLLGDGIGRLVRDSLWRRFGDRLLDGGLLGDRGLVGRGLLGCDVLRVLAHHAPRGSGRDRIATSRAIGEGGR